MSDRVKDIQAAVLACDLDVDRIGFLRSFRRLKDASEHVVGIGVLGVAEEILASVEFILGVDAVTQILGNDPRMTELMIVAHALATRLAPSMDELEKKLHDLTETVTED